MDVDESRLLRESLRSLFAQLRAEPEDIAPALREFGWDEVVSEEPSAVALLFEELGRAHVVSSLLDEIVLRAVRVEPAATAVAYPLGPRAAWFEPAVVAEDTRLRVDAVLRTVGGVPEAVLVPTATPDGTTLHLIPGTFFAPPLATGLDPDGGWSRVDVEVGLDTAVALASGVAWGEAVAAGRRVLAAELVGLARTALEIASAHVTDRRQFGRPIGAFQAVRFRLAEVKVAIEAAAEAVRLAFAAPDPLASAVAKALAGDALDRAVRHAAQVCGAMGLTWEFPLHRIIRRGFALDGLFGDAKALTAELGRHVLRSGEIPQLDPLSVDPMAAP